MRGKDWAVFVLRLCIAAMMIAGHGWRKVVDFETLRVSFSDPFALGPAFTLYLALLVELAGSLLLLIGLATRYAAAGLLLAMLTAAFIVHGGGPWAKMELPLLYALVYLTLLLAGAGRISLDAFLYRVFRDCDNLFARLFHP
ncbi:MAG: hypothetical protein MAG453_00566 [Calditrichaeota bacterium]|nr:hypothetical protein [Calditrichota bacterium]